MTLIHERARHPRQTINRIEKAVFFDVDDIHGAVGSVGQIQLHSAKVHRGVVKAPRSLVRR